jgi:glutamate formiminotransferase/formiminotetrahydrofolate cyclodeaminase
MSSSSDRLVALDLDAFCQRVTGADPTPAGGSVAAALGALGASLVSMAFHHAAREGAREGASDREGGPPIPAYMEGRAEELEDLRDLLLELVDRDAQAYARLRRAEPDSAAASSAGLEALEAPMETVEFSLAALRLLAVGRPEVSAVLASDCEAARAALVAAIDGAAAAAEVNLAELGEVAGEHASTLAALRAEAAALAQELEGTPA